MGRWGILDQVTAALQKELQWPQTGKEHPPVRGYGGLQIAKKQVSLSQTPDAVQAGPALSCWDSSWELSLPDIQLPNGLLNILGV